MRVAIVSKHNEVASIGDGVDIEIYDITGLFYKELALFRSLDRYELKEKLALFRVEEIICQGVNDQIREQFPTITFFEMADTSKYRALFTYLEHLDMREREEPKPHIPPTDLRSILYGEFGSDTFDPYYTDDDEIGGS